MPQAGFIRLALLLTAVLAVCEVSSQTAPAPAGTTSNRTPGPSETVSTGGAMLSAPIPSTVAAKGPAMSPTPSTQAAPGNPAPQPAGFPQVSNPWDVRNPSASDDLPLTGELAPAGGSTPEQFHLALTGDNGMYVTWVSGPATIKQGAVNLANVACTASIVNYGISASKLNQTTSGSATAYTQLYGLTYGFEQNYSSPYIHHVKLQGLTPNTTYFYTVGDGTPSGTSAVMNFTSAPPVGTAGFRLVVLADWGQTYNSSSTRDHIRQSLASNPMTGAAAHVLYVGDYAYSDNYQSNGTYTTQLANTTAHLTYQTYQPREDSWGRFIAPITQGYAFMGAVGNHEIQLEQGYDNKTNFQSWLARFVHPWRESGSSSPFYYSYNYGNAHVISIANYVWPDYKYSSPQYKWLQHDLASVNRTLTPWIIVEIHNPWYSTYASFKQMDCLRQVLEPLLYHYGVDLVYNGHVHAYERFYPVNDWQLDTCGYTSVVIGDGGNSEGLSTQFADAPGQCTAVTTGTYYFQDSCPTDAPGFNGAYFPGGNVSGFCPPTNYQPSVSAFREPSFGHGTLDIINATHALWGWHRNQDGAMVTADSHYIVRNTAACPSKTGAPNATAIPQPTINSINGYYSATIGPAANNYSGFAPTYGTNVDASGSLLTPTSPLSCAAGSPGKAPASAPAAAPSKAPAAALTPSVSTAGK